MKKIYSAVILSTSLFLTACNSGAPDCADSATKEDDFPSDCAQPD